MKVSAGIDARDALKWAMQTRSTPQSASAPSLSRSVRMRAGTVADAASRAPCTEAKYSRGCGSKVSTQAGKRMLAGGGR
jgi:hypothetical protein